MKHNFYKGTVKKMLSIGLVAMFTVTAFAGCAKSNADTKNPTIAPTQSASSEDAEIAYSAGTYSATVTGMHEMTVTVTVSDTAITDIQIDHKETPGVGEPAIKSISAEIIEIQGLAVDAVSGATLTSNAIIEGVTECLKQAGLSESEINLLLTVKKITEQAEDQELTADVLVIGAGGAGMAAAVTANQAGKTVIVIEKASKMGGNTILSGGALNAVDEGSETAIANKDSVENHYNQTFEGGDKKGDSVLVHTLVDNAWPGVEWLKSLGMEFFDGVFTVTGGMWPRAHKPVEPEGTGFFKTYQNYIDNHTGITMVYNTTAKEFIMEDGVVTGVVCTGETGNTVTAKATNGIILATGGFGRNVEMRMKYNEISKKWPTLDETIPSTNTSGITGDGIIMAEAIGANLVQMENIQLLPLGDPETGSLSGNIEHAVESRIFINLEGNRFVNEGGRRDDMTLALFEQPETKMYIVMDSDTYQKGNEINNFGESIADLVSAGRALKAETLEELAGLMNVPADNLIASVEEYNRYCKGGDLEGQTDKFGRTLFTDTDGVNNGINNGPYYAAIRVPTVHHTMGGVQINEQAQIIDTNGNVITGLFAAGEVTGGIHGTNRLGGNALTDTVVFGRIAGTNAAAFER
ncbi:flavocytochrome c [Anaerocolumna sp.]|uniref:flavocytochrome c n=1 Tax=Anaerocolumna sp. TaxID=2041569 RepID=UPI0028AF0780|nr:flavocytochrome c [Anaerocolumna sp.]